MFNETLIRKAVTAEKPCVMRKKKRGLPSFDSKRDKPFTRQ